MNAEDMGQPILVEGWPLVKVCFVGPANEVQVQSWLQQMDDLFLRRTRFGLLTKTDEDSDFSAAGRKAMGLWFKLRREQLGLSRAPLVSRRFWLGRMGNEGGREDCRKWNVESGK